MLMVTGPSIVEKNTEFTGDTSPIFFFFFFFWLILSWVKRDPFLSRSCMYECESVWEFRPSFPCTMSMTPTCSIACSPPSAGRHHESWFYFRSWLLIERDGSAQTKPAVVQWTKYRRVCGLPLKLNQWTGVPTMVHYVESRGNIKLFSNM